MLNTAAIYTEELGDLLGGVTLEQMLDGKVPPVLQNILEACTSHAGKQGKP